MNFTGWVPLRRNILEHTMNGNISNNEFIVMMALILLADKSTGRGTINAPAIRAYLPGLTYNSAKDALESLEKASYIYRQIVFKSKTVYPYWVNRYEVTDGIHKGLQTDLSQVFVSRDTKDIRYVTPPPHGPLLRQRQKQPQTTPETGPGSPLYNNKEKKNDRVQEEGHSPTTNKEMPADSCTPNDNVVNTEQRSEAPAIETRGAHSAASEARDLETSGEKSFGDESSDEERDIDSGYCDADTGQPLTLPELVHRFDVAGVSYLDTLDEPGVPEEAYQRMKVIKTDFNTTA
jgi:hypothetical protein